MRCVLLQLLLSLSIPAIAVLAAITDTTTQASNNQRTSYYPNANINKTTLQSNWGQIFRTQLPGGLADVISTQILVYTPPSHAQVIVITTGACNVYIADAKSGNIIASQNFGVTTPLGPCINGSPVIDPATGTLYFVAHTYPGNVDKVYMHAVNVLSLVEAPNFPVLFTGIQAMNNQGTTFGLQRQRPGLLLDGGIVYAGFGALNEVPPFQGWIIGVNAQSGVITTAFASVVGANAFGGGIWQGGCGPSSLGDGTLLFATGNGFGTPTLYGPIAGNAPMPNLNEAVVRLNTATSQKQDFFSPFNRTLMDFNDRDFSSGGVTLLPSNVFSSPTIPQLAYIESKDGAGYFLNYNDLGGYQQGPGQTDRADIIQINPHTYGGIGMWGCMGVYPNEGGYVYIAIATGYVQAWQMVTTNGQISFVLAGLSQNKVSGGAGSPAITGTVGNSILWLVYSPNNGKTGFFSGGTQISAFSAIPVDGVLQLLWTSTPISTMVFANPSFGNGRVYVGTDTGAVIGYGVGGITPTATTSASNTPVSTTKSVQTATATYSIVPAGRALAYAFASDPSTPIPNPLPVYVGDVLMFSMGVHNVVEGVANATSCVPAKNVTRFQSPGYFNYPNSFTYTIAPSDANQIINFYCDYQQHCLSGMSSSLQVNGTIPKWYVPPKPANTTTTVSSSGSSTTSAAVVRPSFTPIVNGTWGPPLTPSTVSYSFTITNQTVSDDGVTRYALGINGGPGRNSPIRCKSGDTVIVSVTNGLGVPTTLHWHGLLQLGSNVMDGAAGVTQCPIAPGATYTYTFQTTGQEGTYWWHAHYGAQYIDGLRGPFIISNPSNPLETVYSNDMTVVLEDWHHDQSAVLVSSYLNAQSNPSYMEPHPDSVLINGNGVFDCSSYSGSLPCNQKSTNTVFNVAGGSTSRLRIINMAAFATFAFSIDSHKLVVVEVDGVEVQPYSVDSLIVYVGQRYSVIVNANQGIAQYWMRSIMQDNTPYIVTPPPAAFQGTALAIFAYNGATNPPTSTPAASPVIPDDTMYTPVLTSDAAVLGANALNLQYFFSFKGNGSTFAANNKVIQVGGSVLVDSTFVPPAESMYAIVANGKQLPATANSITLTLNQVVQVTILNSDPMVHPFHLHGHVFWIMAKGVGAAPTTFNTVNPMRRDTVAVPAYGYVVIRFIADHAGVWLFHCHFEWHMAAGMVISFVTSPTTIQANGLDAQYQKTCAAFSAWKPCVNPIGNMPVRVSGDFAGWNPNNPDALMQYDTTRCQYAVSFKGSPPDAVIPWTANSTVRYKIVVDGGNPDGGWYGCNANCNGTCYYGNDGTSMFYTDSNASATVLYDPVTNCASQLGCNNPFAAMNVYATGTFAQQSAWSLTNQNAVMSFDFASCQYFVKFRQSPPGAVVPWKSNQGVEFKVSVSSGVVYGCSTSNCTCGPNGGCMATTNAQGGMTLFFSPTTYGLSSSLAGFGSGCLNPYQGMPVSVSGTFSVGGAFNPADQSANMIWDPAYCRYFLTYYQSPAGAITPFVANGGGQYLISVDAAVHGWFGCLGNCTCGPDPNPRKTCSFATDAQNHVTFYFDPSNGNTWSQTGVASASGCFNRYAGLGVYITGPFGNWNPTLVGGAMTFDATKCRYSINLPGTLPPFTANSQVTYKVVVDNGNPDGGWFGCATSTNGTCSPNNDGTLVFFTDNNGAATIYFDPNSGNSWQAGCNNPLFGDLVFVTGPFSVAQAWSNANANGVMTFDRNLCLYYISYTGSPSNSINPTVAGGSYPYRVVVAPNGPNNQQWYGCDTGNCTCSDPTYRNCMLTTTAQNRVTIYFDPVTKSSWSSNTPPASFTGCSNPYANTNVVVTGTFATVTAFNPGNTNGIMQFDPVNCRYSIQYNGSPAGAVVPFVPNTVSSYEIFINNGLFGSFGCTLGNCTCSTLPNSQKNYAYTINNSESIQFFFDPANGNTWSSSTASNCTNPYANSLVVVSGSFASGTQWNAVNPNGVMTYDNVNCRYAVTYPKSPPDAVVGYGSYSEIRYKVAVTTNGVSQWFGCVLGSPGTCSHWLDSTSVFHVGTGPVTIYFDPLSGYTWQQGCNDPFEGIPVVVTGGFAETAAWTALNANGMMTFDHNLCVYYKTFSGSPPKAVQPTNPNSNYEYKVVTGDGNNWFGCSTSNCTCGENDSCVFSTNAANTVTVYFDPNTRSTWSTFVPPADYNGCDNPFLGWYSGIPVTVTGAFSTTAQFLASNTNGVMTFDAANCIYYLSFKGSPPGATVPLTPNMVGAAYKVNVDHGDYGWYGCDYGPCDCAPQPNPNNYCAFATDAATSVSFFYRPSTGETWTTTGTYKGCTNPFAGQKVALVGDFSAGNAFNVASPTVFMTFDGTNCRYTYSFTASPAGATVPLIANSTSRYEVVVGNNIYNCKSGSNGTCSMFQDGTSMFYTDVNGAATVFFDPNKKNTWQQGCTNPLANQTVIATGLFSGVSAWSPTNPNGVMTFDSSICAYYLTYNGSPANANTSLVASGSYEYQVQVGATSYGCGIGNCTCGSVQKGSCLMKMSTSNTVTIYFDPNTKKTWPSQSTAPQYNGCANPFNGVPIIVTGSFASPTAYSSANTNGLMVFDPILCRYSLTFNGSPQGAVTPLLPNAVSSYKVAINHGLFGWRGCDTGNCTCSAGANPNKYCYMKTDASTSVSFYFDLTTGRTWMLSGGTTISSTATAPLSTQTLLASSYGTVAAIQSSLSTLSGSIFMSTSVASATSNAAIASATSAVSLSSLVSLNASSKAMSSTQYSSSTMSITTISISTNNSNAGSATTFAMSSRPTSFLSTTSTLAALNSSSPTVSPAQYSSSTAISMALSSSATTYVSSSTLSSTASVPASSTSSAVSSSTLTQSSQGTTIMTASSSSTLSTTTTGCANPLATSSVSLYGDFSVGSAFAKTAQNPVMAFDTSKCLYSYSFNGSPSGAFVPLTANSTSRYGVLVGSSVYNCKSGSNGTCSIFQDGTSMFYTDANVRATIYFDPVTKNTWQQGCTNPLANQTVVVTGAFAGMSKWSPSNPNGVMTFDSSICAYYLTYNGSPANAISPLSASSSYEYLVQVGGSTAYGCTLGNCTCGSTQAGSCMMTTSASNTVTIFFDPNSKKTWPSQSYAPQYNGCANPYNGVPVIVSGPFAAPTAYSSANTNGAMLFDPIRCRYNLTYNGSPAGAVTPLKANGASSYKVAINHALFGWRGCDTGNCTCNAGTNPNMYCGLTTDAFTSVTFFLDLITGNTWTVPGNGNTISSSSTSTVISTTTAVSSSASRTSSAATTLSSVTSAFSSTSKVASTVLSQASSASHT